MILLRTSIGLRGLPNLLTIYLLYYRLEFTVIVIVTVLEYYFKLQFSAAWSIHGKGLS